MRSGALNSSESPKPRKASRADVADILALVGFMAFAIGVALQFGFPWALLVAGGLLLAIGLLAAWRRS